MLTEVIDKGSVSYCGCNDKDSAGVSLSDTLFSFMLERYTVCDEAFHTYGYDHYAWSPQISACGLPWIIMDRLCILVIILSRSTVVKTFYYNDNKIADCLKWLIPEARLLHIWHNTSWLCNGIWTRTGEWECNYSHGGGTSSPSHWKQV